MVPAVTDACRPHAAHSSRGPTGHALPAPHLGHRNPAGHRSCARYARHASAGFALSRLNALTVPWMRPWLAHLEGLRDAGVDLVQSVRKHGSRGNQRRRQRRHGGRPPERVGKRGYRPVGQNLRTDPVLPRRAHIDPPRERIADDRIPISFVGRRHGAIERARIRRGRPRGIVDGVAGVVVEKNLPGRRVRVGPDLGEGRDVAEVRALAADAHAA